MNICRLFPFDSLWSCGKVLLNKLRHNHPSIQSPVVLFVFVFVFVTLIIIIDHHHYHH